MHHIGYCLSIASGAGRTLIFEDEGNKWAYNVQWNEIFEQISNCSYLENVKPFLPIPTYSEPGQSDRIVFLDIRGCMVRVMKKEIPHAPEVAPNEIKDFLLENHPNPPLWFLGQLIKYAGRENEKTKNETNQIYSRIPFECGPIVGIHVRLTDKKAETKLHDLEEYMEWVDFWYDVMVGHEKILDNDQLVNSNCTNKRKLFIATDEPNSVVEEANRKWGNKYEIFRGKQDLQYGFHQDDPERISREALIEFLSEIRILSNCQFVVCTFSSNVCRLTYELMQTIKGDASENVHSLDYFYAEYWFENEMEAIAEYKKVHEYPMSPEEIDAEKGDIIVVRTPIHNDGFIRGKNLRSNREGRFPMYLLKEHSRFENFTTFINLS
uniref:Uncharacterized protein n=2 Tax=Meloidogyne TaxID=189290 RepID=A0A6V7UG79_MELEN|nr:unnamed protein product [Meloidogyne enterolobii]